MAAASLEASAREAIEGARAAGFATAVWTNNARDITAEALARFDLLSVLDLVVTRDEMRALKPDPDGWRVIVEHFGIPHDAVVVGDSWVDGVAAPAARGALRGAGERVGADSAGAGRPAGRSHAAALARRDRRPGSLAGAGPRAAQRDRERRAALDDPVGAAGLRQDDAGLADG